MKILSIDWDYFIDASLSERMRMFPDGGTENVPLFVQNIIWSSHYKDGVEQIGIKEKEYEQIKKKLSNSFESVMIADSHKHIYDFIQHETFGKIEIVNIDFHHDLYGYKEKHRTDVDCGNWASKLFENGNCQYTWVKQSDSDDVLHVDLLKSIEVKEFDDILDEEYDLVYICRSGMWSPPHLDKFFLELCQPLLEQEEFPVRYELNVMENRYTDEFKKMVEDQKKMYQEMKNKMKEKQDVEKCR